MNENINILIVDDDPEVLFATVRIIEAEGYKAKSASSGSECRTLAGEYHPDLILMDVVLPDIEGTELCRELKSDPDLKDTYIILISGMKKTSIEQASGLDVGADGYIARPISNQELKARVNAMVRIIKAERERDRLIIELREALKHIKRLSGLLPLCSHCKQVRDDKGYWNQIDAYLQEHSDVDISHSICPDCAKKYYPEMKLYEEE